MRIERELTFSAGRARLKAEAGALCCHVAKVASWRIVVRKMGPVGLWREAAGVGFHKGSI